jgi:hypothetical protein
VHSPDFPIVPHSGALNIFLRFSAMHVFVCSECGEGVAIQEAVQ